MALLIVRIPLDDFPARDVDKFIISRALERDSAETAIEYLPFPLPLVVAVGAGKDRKVLNFVLNKTRRGYYLENENYTPPPLPSLSRKFEAVG